LSRDIDLVDLDLHLDIDLDLEPLLLWKNTLRSIVTILDRST
jgi:hypothetical protein